MANKTYIELVPQIVAEDVKVLNQKDAEYGGSWKKRGGVGAFMMLARKWDRLEEQVRAKGWDVFRAPEEDHRQQGLNDGARDLRRYLCLVEAEILSRNEGRE